MDTKTLVVGQDVYVENKIRSNKGTVIKVTPSGVEVQTETGILLRFDNDGCSCGDAWYEGSWHSWHKGSWHIRAMIDTKTLVVGQEVYMFSGISICKGKVIEVTPSGVVVQTSQLSEPMDGRAQGRSKDDPVDWDSWRGICKGCQEQSLGKRSPQHCQEQHLPIPLAHNAGTSGLLRFDSNGEGCDGLGTYYGEEPWHIDAMPFAERKALLEEGIIP